MASRKGSPTAQFYLAMAHEQVMYCNNGIVHNNDLKLGVFFTSRGNYWPTDVILVEHMLIRKVKDIKSAYVPNPGRCPVNNVICFIMCGA